MFAVEILKASRDSDNIIVDKEKNLIPIEYDADWIDGESYIEYVEPIAEIREKIVNEVQNDTSTEEAFKIGCIGLVILLLTCIVTGFITIIKWFIE